MKRKHPPSVYLAALQKCGGSRILAARELGVSLHAVAKNLKILREQGQEIPDSPYKTDRQAYMIREAEAAHGASPTGFVVKGVSTLYGAEGEIKGQWVKTKEKQRTPEEWAQIVRESFKGATPVAKIAGPRDVDRDLLTVYPVGDHHVAMYAWADEAGGNYDVSIAEQLLISAATHLTSVGPPSETGLIAILGDFFHVDNLQNRTARSGNPLDVDSRYAAMIHAGVRMLRTFVELGLRKHKRIKILAVPGNHDDIGALWLSLALALLYEKNPRVEVTQAPGRFQYHRHGKTLLGITHGDTASLDKLGGIMSVDRAQDWGETLFRYWLTGHIHQRRVIEVHGALAESFRVLPPGDSWAHGAGYRSGRDMHAVIYSKRAGEIGRHRIDAVTLLETRA